MDLQVTVGQVAVRNTSNGRTVYDVLCGDGITRQVWEANLANAINAFTNTGQQIWIRASEKQNGQYTNRSIHAFAPPGQALPPDTGQGGGPGGGNRGGFGGKGMTAEDKTRISKMACQNVAYNFIGALLQGAGPEALTQGTELAEDLTKTLYKSARSHEKPETTVLQTGAQGQVLPVGGGGAQVLPSAGQPVAGTPAEVAAQVPGVQVGAAGVAQVQDASAEAPQAAPAGDDIDWS